MSKKYNDPLTSIAPLALESYDPLFFENQIMTVDELAAYLKVSPKTIYRKALRGELPSARVGRSYRFLLFEILQWAKNGGDYGERKAV